MEKSKILPTFGLILIFSASNTFAENTIVDTRQMSQNFGDVIRDTQREAGIATKSIASRVIDETAEIKAMQARVHIGSSNNYPPPPKNILREPHLLFLPKDRFGAPHGTGKWKTIKISRHRSERSLRKNTARKYMHISKKSMRLYQAIYYGASPETLTHAQLMELKRLHMSVAKTMTARIVLNTIMQAEDGGPLVIVGRGVGKSAEFKRIMNNLNFSCHPYKQFPAKYHGFVFNRKLGKYSTAAGCFQITYSNWKRYAKLFDLKDFSVQNQKIVALELIRTGRTHESGNYNGRGYIEILKGNTHKAIRYGTNDWASSPYSQWRGTHPRNYDQLVSSNAKDLQRPGRSGNA